MSELSAKTSIRNAVQEIARLCELAAKDNDIPAGRVINRELGIQIGRVYWDDIQPRKRQAGDFELRAGDVTDANLGTLAGTMVALEALDIFAFENPLVSNVYFDVGVDPGNYKQPENTRIIVQPGIGTYNSGNDANGRPLGWVPVTPAQTIDVSVTLDEHVGVPIIFNSNQLSGTNRKLFGEQGPGVAAALGDYVAQKAYRLLTPANFNAYAAINAPFVPAIFPYYAVGLGNFGRSTLTKVGAIFSKNRVPSANRFTLLDADYFGQISDHPAYVASYQGNYDTDNDADNRLGKIASFRPVEAADLTANNPTPNLVGAALHKCAIVVKIRPPVAYMAAMPDSITGRSINVTLPKNNLTVNVTEYLSHESGTAGWRMSALLGASVGDNRGGLLFTSQ